MTEQEQVEADEEQREAAENGENDSEDQPDIEPDEQADMGGLAEIAEEVEEEAGADVDDDQDDSDGDDSAGEKMAETAPAAPSEAGTPNWGDLYVGTVTTGLNAAIDKFGDEDAEYIDESLARDLHLDQYVNEWMAQQDRGDMDPAQGMVLSTVGLCVTVLVMHTDLPSRALNKAKSEQ